VVDERLVRPVLRVAGAGLAGPVGGAGPGGPEEEGGQRLLPFGGGQGVRRDGVLVPAPGGDVGVVLGVGPGRLGPGGGNGQGAGGGVGGVGAEDLLEPGPQGGLVFQGQPRVALRPPLPGPVVEDEDELAVQPVGGPVRGDVGAVAPDGTDLLTAQRLP